MRLTRYLVATTAVAVAVAVTTSGPAPAKPPKQAQQHLGDLDCGVDQVPKFDGLVWVCGEDETGATSEFPVIRDGDGAPVGKFQDASNSSALVRLDLAALGVFNGKSVTAVVTQQEIRVLLNRGPWFESANCTGTILMLLSISTNATDPTPIAPPAELIPASEFDARHFGQFFFSTTLYVGDPDTERILDVAGVTFSRLSQSDGICEFSTRSPGEKWRVLDAEVAVPDLTAIHPPPYKLHLGP